MQVRPRVRHRRRRRHVAPPGGPRGVLHQRAHSDGGAQAGIRAHVRHGEAMSKKTYEDLRRSNSSKVYAYEDLQSD